MKLFSCVSLILCVFFGVMAQAEQFETHEPFLLEANQTAADCAKKMSEAILADSREYKNLVIADVSYEPFQSWIQSFHDNSTKFYVVAKDPQGKIFNGFIWVNFEQKHQIQSDGSDSILHECSLSETNCGGSFILGQGWTSSHLTNGKDCPPILGY